MMESAVPAASHSLWDDAVRVHCFGAAHNWSIRGAAPEEAEQGNPGVLDRIRKVAIENDCTIFAPNPSTFNARIAGMEAIKAEWIKVGLYRGAQADGVLLDAPCTELGSHTAFGVASADCPTIIARNPETGRVVAAHAGRESLYDADALFKGAQPRRHASVVDAIMWALVPGRWDQARFLQVFTACGIQSAHYLHPWNDELHGERNRIMCKHLSDAWGSTVVLPDHSLSLRALIARQFEEHGIETRSIRHDTIDTFGDRDGDQPRWHSNRRDKNGQRNFVLVVRHR